jgi:hypothetical protein
VEGSLAMTFLELAHFMLEATLKQ